MDPDEALRLARAALARVRQVNLNALKTMNAAGELADAFEALDQWLSNGGFLPEDWAHAPRV